MAVGAAGLAWVLASQWLMTRTPPSPWSAVALLTPMLGLLAVTTWRRRHRVWSVCAAAAAAALVLQTASGHGLSAEPLYLLENVSIHLFLALWFGRTLRADTKPLISRLAARVHRGLTPAMERYTRKVTVAWTIYFASMALLSIGLYIGAPFEVWATFANLFTPLAVALMFVGEFVLRYRLHPEFERATIADAIRAYTQRPQPPAQRPSP